MAKARLPEATTKLGKTEKRMNFKRKLLSKILALVLVLQLLVNPIAVGLVYAEENPTPTPIADFISPAPSSEVTPTPDQTPTSTPAPVSTIETGGADSSSQTDTIVNTNTDNVPGTLSTGSGCTPPEGQTTCPNDVSINNDNSANIGDSASSLALTGDNSASGTNRDVEIIAGDATASGTIKTEVNTNLVILDPTATPSGIELTLTPTPNQENSLSSNPPNPSNPSDSSSDSQKSLTVENNNNADVNNTDQVTAKTGENIASENLGDAKITTGDALALANVLNFINTNVVGSNFDIMVLDLSTSGSSDINLNEIWKQILNQQGMVSLSLIGESNASNLRITIINNNSCKLENNVQVTAGTGGNEASNNNSAEINTGGATALANVNNFVNTNIFGSKFFFGIINITSDQSGNLILPRPESFLLPNTSGDGSASAIFQNFNVANINNNVESSAGTGDNTASTENGNSSVNTGNANSIANSVTIANFNAWLNNYLFFRINNLSGWNGNILGWTTPDSSEVSQSNGQDFEVSSEAPIGGASGIPASTTLFENTNEATVINNIKVDANTGNNKANNNASGSQINTGNARSVANLFNLVNANILSSNWFFGMVNILGNWKGNVIFAYPDLSIALGGQNSEVEVGNTIDLTVTYENKGYDDARNSQVKLAIPQGLSYLNDTSGTKPAKEGDNYAWSIGDLKPGQKSNFIISLGVNSDFNFDNLQSFWSKIIKEAYAAENEKEKKISILASIGGSDPESSLINNLSSIETTIYKPIVTSSDSENNGDQRQPTLVISASNNVNTFVYPGDTVSFEVKVKNTSDVPSYNTIVLQKLYNGGPEDFGTFKFNIGTVNPGKEGKLTFGLKLPNNGTLTADHYRTITQASGKAPNGNAISSNEAGTNFDVKLLAATFMPRIVEAKETNQEEGQVLGAATSCPSTKDILPYILLLAMSSFYLTSWIKFRLVKGFNA